jgi:hypothetical protein
MALEGRDGEAQRDDEGLVVPIKSMQWALLVPAFRQVRPVFCVGVCVGSPLAHSWILRRGGPDDYDVIHDGETVGRIYRMKADRELWRWMIRLWAPPPGPSGGVSATLDEAMAAFRAKWDAQG